ncbi:MAG: cytochrome c biogenesis protein CcdA [bacterium]
MRLVFIFVLLACASLGRADDPFTVTARLDRAEAAWRVVVQVDVPPRHDLYADERFAVQVNGKALPGRITPAPALQPGADGQPEQVFTSRVEAVYALDAVRGPVAVRVSWQGCSDTSCFPPGTTTFVLTPAGEVAREVAPRAAVMPSGAVSWTAGIQIENSAAGYLGSRAFLDFLASSGGGEPGAPQGWSRQFLADPAAFLSRHGMAWTLLLMLLGGLLLNLTPCVLPMIPINLAIIGAGARAGSRRRGLALGAAYGAGIALVYGALGVAVVLSGSVFGTLQSSPVFNGIMAVIFLALALAMVDVIPIDLARFQRGGGSGGGILTAGVAGGVSALLAGACVAPVVAAVLLLAGSMYHAGSSAALLLPFMLGLGMALPWPFAGAGMAVLPRPGAWMLRVKYGFGVLIAIMGIYYGWLAYTGFAARTPAATAGNELRAGDLAGWTKWLAAAKAEHKPLLLDFHASWCKNCHAMDRTTFRDPAVRRALEKFIVVRVAAERPGEEPARGMCQAFGVLGLPTYVVVQVKDL